MFWTTIAFLVITVLSIYFHVRKTENAAAARARPAARARACARCGKTVAAGEAVCAHCGVPCLLYTSDAADE